MNHLSLLNRKLRELYPYWVQFGNVLPVKQSDINEIQANRQDYSKSDRTKLCEALEKWKKKGGKRTWKVVHVALMKLDENKTADNIQEAFPDLEIDGNYYNTLYCYLKPSLYMYYMIWDASFEVEARNCQDNELARLSQCMYPNILYTSIPCLCNI